ncbi:tryptophan synthase beta subunit-like PLP-dependent enzyme, partial [Ochromonadaceae sp. CCMP2298]
DLGLTGNLLFDRLVGADVRLVSPSAYAMIGSDALCAQLEGQLRAEGRRPYVIPVGGSNQLGAFGYLQFVQELLETGGEEGGEGAVAPGAPYDHIVFGCGSGGTAAGIAIGVLLSPLHGRTMVHAVGVCDSPDVFYEHVRDVAVELGLDPALLGDVRSWLKVYEGQGVGYAKSTEEELRFLVQVAQRTGILLDPVYSGKALFHLVNREQKQGGAVFQRGQRVLFLHTGGGLGLYDKESQLLPLLPPGKVSRMQLQAPTPSPPSPPASS